MKAEFIEPTVHYISKQYLIGTRRVRTVNFGINQRMGDPSFEELEGLYLTFSSQKLGLGLKGGHIFMYERHPEITFFSPFKNECVTGKTGKSNTNGFKQQQCVSM